MCLLLKQKRQHKISKVTVKFRAFVTAEQDHMNIGQKYNPR